MGQRDIRTLGHGPRHGGEFLDYSWPCRLLHLGAREHDEDISAGLGKLGHLGREKVDRWTIQEQVDNTGAWWTVDRDHIDQMRARVSRRLCLKSFSP